MGSLILPEQKIFSDMASAILLSPLPTIREFAESKIIIPDGPFANMRLRVHRQPYLGFILDAMDSNEYKKFVLAGPVQSGKTLCILIPLMYHLFEIGETVVFGVPTEAIAAEKWQKDIKPMITASPVFNALMPTRGPGSRDSGSPTMITFKNGAILKFMTGRGRDESRSHFTTRVVFISEVDKMDRTSKVSRETDPVHQLEGRNGAHGSDARTYMECSPTYSSGRIWQEYEASTMSKIAMCCPRCNALRLFERRHFKGWEVAKTVYDAEQAARFYCPACDHPWTKKQRQDAVAKGVLIHKGMEISGKNKIAGKRQPGTTFGLNWNAPHNMFIDEIILGGREFVAANNANDLDESGEKDVLQQRWGLPYSPPKSDYKQAKVGDITARMASKKSGLVKGVVPEDAEKIVVGLDVGKYTLHWVALARREDSHYHVFDYDAMQVFSDAMPETEAVQRALKETWEMCFSKGWPTASGGNMEITTWGIDAGYLTKDAVYPFLQTVPSEVVLGTMGFGYDQLPGTQYRPSSEKRQSTVALAGKFWQIIHVPDYEVWRVDFDADHYKSLVQQSIVLPLSSPRAMTLYYKSNPKEHLTIAKHFASESLDSEFVTGKGWQTRHVVRFWQNHYLDAAAIAWLLFDVSDTAESAEHEEVGSSEPQIILNSILGDGHGKE